MWYWCVFCANLVTGKYERELGQKTKKEFQALFFNSKYEDRLFRQTETAWSKWAPTAAEQPGSLDDFLHCRHSSVYKRFYEVLSTHGYHSTETFRFAYNMHNQLLGSTLPLEKETKCRLYVDPLALDKCM